MKKLIFLISLFIFFIVPVKADTITIPTAFSKSDYQANFNLSIYNIILNYYNTNYYSNYPYYVITVSGHSNYLITLYAFESTNNVTYFSNSSDSYISLCDKTLIIQFLNNQIVSNISDNQACYLINTVNLDSNDPLSYDYDYFDSNFNITANLDNFSYDSVGISHFYDDVIIINNNSTVPKLKDLLDSSSWSEYENNHLENYITVNLDNYEYVLLTLKNYNQSEPFQTTLQVKGQIGITPIYNYGQTSKDSITGSQVQDRCNASYNNYTAYPLYILQTDLQNNSIYAVKSCSSNSSFKFDSNIFNISFVTSQNVDNPTVTINGQTYDVIPYSDLPSTATKNEADNYIPGQSGSAVDSSGIDSAIKGVQQGLSTLWNTFTYFTDFVGLIFSSLPIELRTILLSAFVVAITIGLIKLFTN